MESKGNTPDIIELEKEVASVETDALEEEKYNASNVYSILDRQLSELEEKIPYKDIRPFDTAHGYDEIARLQHKKSVNKSYWEKRDIQKEYCKNDRLYFGHLLFNNGEYYIMDSRLESRFLEDGSSKMLINADDEKFSNIVKAWRYPNQKEGVSLSRNIMMANRTVKNVDVVLDTNSTMFSNITDAYLRKALIRNRMASSLDPGTNMQSIIQTIQEKQDEIRSVNVHDSFITQGCAGSGKTMVLLHRLRYLLFNKELDPDEYILLVPSLRFKKFIKNIATEFRISDRNIFSYQLYYQTLCGKGKEILEDDIDENVFDEDFLAKVYSNDFYIEAYKKLFDELQRQVEGVLEYSEECLNILIIREQKNVDKEIDSVEKEAIYRISEVIGVVSEQISNTIECLDRVPSVIEEIQEIYTKNKLIQEALVNDDTKIQIDPEDERIVLHPILKNYKIEIENEEEAVKNANIFTVRAHQNKLVKLKEQYEKFYKDLESLIIEEEKEKLASRAADMKYISEGVTLEDLHSMIDEITFIYEDAVFRLTDAKRRKENINDYIAEKYKEGINALNELIDISPLIREESSKYVSSLIPSYDYFVSVMELGMALVKAFGGQSKEDRLKREKLKLFTIRTNIQAWSYLNILLLNNCKKAIKEEFDITICKQYKHYWFITLYCQYLTRPQNSHKYSFIYIDECQDLSKAEIELICKINSIQAMEEDKIAGPVINIFGDVNQTITKHGISNWEEISFINTRYLLDENFRNPNQIVEYCNNILPFRMKKVGVDMDPVDHYKSITDMLQQLKQKMNVIYIVKDEYAKKDLRIELDKQNLNAGTIYTVKEVKGLEFKETIVFDRAMTENERYIAYTRALVKLIIVEELSRYTDRGEKLYVQGEENETEVDE